MIILQALAFLALPAFIAAIAVSAAGLARRQPRLAGIGAVLAVPLSLYLHGTPRFEWVGLLFPLCHLGAALAARRRRPWAGWLLLVPPAAFLGWLAFAATR